MKISTIEVFDFSAPLKEPFITSLRRVDQLEDLIVVITTQNGLKGYGQGAPTPPITGETTPSIKAAIAHLSSSLIDRDITDDFEALLSWLHSAIAHNTTAKAMIESALFDLLSKHHNQPLWRYLGGKNTTTIHSDITLSIESPQMMQKQALKAIQEGYRSLKIKLDGDIEQSIQRVQAISEVTHSEVTLRLDPNQAWELKGALEVIEALQKADIAIELLEQPLKANDLESLKILKNQTEAALVLDESVFSMRDARYVLEHSICDAINIKLAKSGGISQALELAKLCAEHEAKCMIGCMLEGPIAIAAAAAVAASQSQSFAYIDLDGVDLLESHSLQSDIVFNQGSITLNTTPGLGVSL